MKIEDNFLNQKEFDKLQTLMMEDSPFPWFYNAQVDFDEDVDKLQFIHVFYDNAAALSPCMHELTPIMSKINLLSIIKIKANLLTRTSEIVENKFHIDSPYTFVSEKKIKQWTTSIFYVNTNNGYTKFEDGTIVESVANRIVTFPANMKHTGTSCTNERTRVVINFNYFKNT